MTISNNVLFPFSRKYILYLFNYDKKEGKLYWKNPPNKRIRPGTEAGSVNFEGYRRIKIHGKSYRAHRIIYFLETGEQPKEIDHRDRNTGNNKFFNLRDGTNGVNQRNKGLRKDNTSGYIGVTWNKRNKKWFVSANQKYIGCFTCKKEAAKVYDETMIVDYYKGNIKVYPSLNFS